MNNKKTALIIGGGRGIGRAVSLRLSQENYHVLINYRSNSSEAQKTLQEIIEMGGSAQIFMFDITDREQTGSSIEALLSDNPQIDALVFCAGIRSDQLFVFMDEKQWDSVIDTNLRSFYGVVRPVVKQMLLNRSGRIVVVSSTSGQTGLAGQVHYSATKAGLIGAVKALAQECAKRNVLVNAVAPGFIETDMTDDIDVKEVSSKIPMQRFGKTSEVASVVSFLLSADAAYMTGQVLGVNGGIYM
jgi:3-oxoacyl-[acyl-carrier protein] reductase